MSFLKEYLNRQVMVLTTDGRVLVGKLEGFDNTTNVILTGTTERIINEIDEDTDEDAPTTISLGVYLCRGASVATVGLLDEEKDQEIDWSKLRGKPIGSTRHDL